LEAARDSLIPPGEHPHLVLCGVKSERGLKNLRRRLTSLGIEHRAFHDSDLVPSLTALCTQPVRGPTRRVFRRYQCLRPRRSATSPTSRDAAPAAPTFDFSIPYKQNETSSMNETMISHKSHWGFHPCDYATYRKLKLLHGWYFQTLRDYAAWRRWSRKEPQNRVIREFLRDERGRCCGVKSTRVRPEPAFCPLFVADGAPDDLGVIGLYRLARRPHESPVLPLTPEESGRIEELFRDAAAYFAAAPRRRTG
jgi:hypothetical protein